MSNDTTEVSGGGYARQTINWTVTNLGPINWPPPPDDPDEVLGDCWDCGEPVRVSSPPCYEFNQEDKRDELYHWDCIHREYARAPEPS